MRPASVRSTSSPFVKAKKKSGSKKLGLDMERITPPDQHLPTDAENNDALRNLRLQLIEAERGGKYSKAKKLRRAINQRLEVGLYLTHSWCQTCQNVLHNCTCRGG